MGILKATTGDEPDSTSVEETLIAVIHSFPISPNMDDVWQKHKAEWKTGLCRALSRYIVHKGYREFLKTSDLLFKPWHRRWRLCYTDQTSSRAIFSKTQQTCRQINSYLRRRDPSNMCSWPFSFAQDKEELQMGPKQPGAEPGSGGQWRDPVPSGLQAILFEYSEHEVWKK